MFVPTTNSQVRTRYGGQADLAAVRALHRRCSAETLHQRFHCPTSRVPARLARRLLAPPDGWSLLAELGDDVVGMCSAGPLSRRELEIGFIVEDAHQGRGIGTRLVRETCSDAATRGYRTVHCWCLPGNEAVLAVLGKAAFPATAWRGDGLVRVDIELPTPGPTCASRRRQRSLPSGETGL